MTIEYSKAVQHAKFYLGAPSQEEMFEEFKLCGPYYEELFGLSYEDKGLEMHGCSHIHHGPANLIKLSITNPAAFDAMRLGIAYFLKKEKSLPPEAVEWLVQYLRGKLTRPRNRVGTKSKINWHKTISHHVGKLVSWGMKATRNDASEATSACDAVAQALYELGKQPSTYHGVKRIWLSNSADQRAFLLKNCD